MRIRGCVRLVVAVGLVGVGVAGCAGGPARGEAAVATCECSVCRENADLACLNVKVTPSTPRVEYGGRTYYFCSEECKAEFQKRPEKFVAGR